MIPKVAFGWLGDPCPVQPAMKNKQYQKKKRQIQVDVRPFMTVKSEKIFLSGLPLSSWYHTSQENTQNRRWGDVDKKRCIN